MKLTVISYNLRNGGCAPKNGVEDGDESRLLKQIEALGTLAGRASGSVAICLQEGKYLDRDYHRRLNLLCDRLGMTYRTMLESNHHDCHLIVTMRLEPGLSVAGTEHDRSGSWWHAQAAAKLQVEGWTERLWVVNTHLAPASRSKRLSEAESLRLHRKRAAIIAGDFNAAGADERLPPTYPDVDLVKAQGKDDRRPARMEAAGFRDAAIIWGDTTPTVGHCGGWPHRSDRIHTTLPDEAIAEYSIYTKAGDLSDHLPVAFTVDLAKATR
ncbi:endonuclease/exonuclease/phosphatase family protein [Spongiactinospora gelatinilytica]|nr:hypothetical protein [Spongiactinospora gelatinilytica]